MALPETVDSGSGVWVLRVLFAPGVTLSRHFYAPAAPTRSDAQRRPGEGN
jgi:hypothetical protein